jgi:hypothetical protein
MDAAQKTSINSTDQTSKRGVEAPAPAAAYVFGPGSLTRGVTVVPLEPGGALP